MELHKNITKINSDTYEVKSLGVFGPAYTVDLRGARRYAKVVNVYRTVSYISIVPILYLLFKFEALSSPATLFIAAACYYIIAALFYHYVLTGRDEQ